jgi:hypothetical protein
LKRVMFISSWGMRVVCIVMIQMKFRLYGYILDNLKTHTSMFTYVSIMCLCFVNTAVSCQLYSSTKLILICFQNINFEKEVCVPWFSAQIYVFMLKKFQFPIR